jgi:dTDP-4-dehydrorhamnose 3,5-epimerase
LYEEKIFKLKKGDVFRCVNKHSKGFNSFGEAYVSFIKNKEIKGWKKHSIMTMNLVVPIGKVKFVFFDKNKKHYTKMIIGQKFYKRISVPPNIWFAFQGMGKKDNLVINFSDIIIRKTNDVESLDLNEIKYNWNR